MKYHQAPKNQRVTAPCIVNNGTLVNKLDIQKLLSDLSRVRYIYIEDEKQQSEGVGYLKEVFSDPHRSTLIANSTIYLNLDSFDYLELAQGASGESYFDLIQSDRKLRLIPLSNPLKKTTSDRLDAAAIEAMMAEVLAASWDIQIDDDEKFTF